MSWLRYMTLWSFRQLNPDWSIRLFTCKQQRKDKYWSDITEQDFFKYDGPDYTNRLKNIPNLEIIPWEIEEERLRHIGPSHKSNFFKWNLLSEEGGVYADMDIVFIRPIYNWFDHVKNSDVAICYNYGPRYFSIGLLGSSGNNPFYKRIYDDCVQKFNMDHYQGAGVEILYHLLGNVCKDPHWQNMCYAFPETRFVNFDMNYIYFWDHNDITAMTEELHTVVPYNTFGLHWYAGHPSSQQLNATLNEDTVQTSQTTIAHFLRQLMNGQTT